MILFFVKNGSNVISAFPDTIDIQDQNNVELFTCAYNNVFIDKLFSRKDCYKTEKSLTNFCDHPYNSYKELQYCISNRVDNKIKYLFNHGEKYFNLEKTLIQFIKLIEKHKFNKYQNHKNIKKHYTNLNNKYKYESHCADLYATAFQQCDTELLLLIAKYLKSEYQKEICNKEIKENKNIYNNILINNFDKQKSTDILSKIHKLTKQKSEHDLEYDLNTPCMDERHFELFEHNYNVFLYAIQN